MWLYGTNGGSLWPKCEIYAEQLCDPATLQPTLQLSKDIHAPHAQECIEFAQAIVDGCAVARPCRTIAASADHFGCRVSQPGIGTRNSPGLIGLVTRRRQRLACLIIVINRSGNHGQRDAALGVRLQVVA